MELPQFEGQNRNELAMIDVAHAILEVRGEIAHFDELLKEVAEYLGLDDKQVKEAMVQFYTDLNIDGGFISMGENRWGLREWYPIDSIDEEITHDNDEEDERPRRRRKKRKALADEFEEELDDEEDFDEDEEEDEEVEEEEEEDIVYGQKVAVDDDGVMVDEDDKEDLGEYAADLSELDTTEEEEEELDEDLVKLDDDEEDEEEEEF